MNHTWGKDLSFEALYDQYFPRVYNYIYGSLMHRQDTEDVTAEVFLRIWRHQEAYDPSLGSLSTWIGAIARHLVQNKLVLASRRQEIPVETTPEQPGEAPVPPEEALTLKQPENQQLYQLLGRLSQEEREFLELRYGLELSYKEIGSLLGLSSEAVRKRYDRLLDKCRRLLAKEKIS